jgi:8-oxo-dGTP diphosphatase
MADKPKVGVGFGVMLLRNNQVLLGRRHDDPEKADSQLNGAGKWTMPGGKLDFGETFETGAEREVSEETSIKVEQAEVICVNQDIVEGAHFVTIGLVCRQFSGEPQVMEPDEITEWKWFDLDNLPSPLYFPSAKIFENYSSKKFYLTEFNF